MDAASVPELEAQIRAGVKLSFVAEKITWKGLLAMDSFLFVRDVAVWVSLQDGRESGLLKPRSRIVVRSKRQKRQSQFKERRSGGFAEDQIIDEVVSRLHLELLAKSTGGERQKQMLHARQDARRLAAHYNLTFPRPMGTEIEGSISVAIKPSKDTPGALRLEFDGLRASEAQQLLGEAKGLKLLPTSKRPSEKSRVSWDYFKDDD